MKDTIANMALTEGLLNERASRERAISATVVLGTDSSRYSVKIDRDADDGDIVAALLTGIKSLGRNVPPGIYGIVNVGGTKLENGAVLMISYALDRADVDWAPFAIVNSEGKILPQKSISPSHPA